MTTVAAAESSAERTFAIRDLDRVQKQTGKNFYLVKGKLVEAPPSRPHRGIIAQHVARILSRCAFENDLGFCAAAETGFKLSTLNAVIAPDFVVEVKRPSDSLSKFINSETETIATFSQNAVSRFKGEETISAEPILKKFRNATSDFFR